VIQHWVVTGEGWDCREHQQRQSEGSTPSSAERRGIERTAFLSESDLRFAYIVHKFCCRPFEGHYETVLRAGHLIGNLETNHTAHNAISYKYLRGVDGPVWRDSLAQTSWSKSASGG
jgi:hypothetical protein